jgi:hypothetical protein
MIPIEGDEGTPPYWHTPFALVANLVTPPPEPTLEITAPCKFPALELELLTVAGPVKLDSAAVLAPEVLTLLLLFLVVVVVVPNKLATLVLPLRPPLTVGLPARELPRELAPLLVLLPALGSGLSAVALLLTFKLSTVPGLPPPLELPELAAPPPLEEDEEHRSLSLLLQYPELSLPDILGGVAAAAAELLLTLEEISPLTFLRVWKFSPPKNNPSTLVLPPRSDICLLCLPCESLLKLSSVEELLACRLRLELASFVVVLPAPAVAAALEEVVAE